MINLHENYVNEQGLEYAMIPGSAVRRVTDCAMAPGKIVVVCLCGDLAVQSTKWGHVKRGQ